jgi:CheY-like chemotaxis protein
MDAVSDRRLTMASNVIMPREPGAGGSGAGDAASAPSGDTSMNECAARIPPYVLVVDDDPDVRDAIAEILRIEGVGVTVARDGCEALSHLTAGAGRPSLILLDLMMPRMDGWELMARLRDNPALALIPVCIVSTSAFVPPGRDVLHKPFEIEALLAVVRRHLR